MRNLVTRYQELNDDSRRAEVVGYHRKPNPVFRDKASQSEIAGLKSEDRTNVSFNGDEYESKFTIGFEIEKDHFHRDALQEYPLFCGFESDSSCGVEAVTHVLPLVGKSMWRTKVFNMFVEAKRIIDDEYSPTNGQCGGHITLACKGMDGEELTNRVRKFSGILYSVFRKRLVNGFCYKNPFMIADEPHTDYSTTTFGKYVICKNTGFGIEFRLPSKVTSVKQLMRRYELMYLIMDYAINKPDARSSFYRAVKPILMSMYEKDEVKVDAIIGLAKHFQKMLDNGKVGKATIGWIEGWWSRTNCRVGRNDITRTRNLPVNPQWSSTRNWTDVRREWIEANRVLR
tara:strand:- start:1914 stop:2942 length:1029 start_codon:yes stop_codon:yes gene_type:complete